MSRNNVHHSLEALLSSLLLGLAPGLAHAEPQPDRPRLAAASQGQLNAEIPPKPEVSGVGLLIAGGVLLIGGTTAGLVAQSELRDDDGVLDEDDVAMLTVAGVGGVAGLVGAILTTIGTVKVVTSSVRKGNWERRYEAASAEVSLVPVLSARGGGMALVGTF